MTIKAFKRQFDPLFSRLLMARVQEYRERCPDPFLEAVIEHVHTLAMAGGKRIRPYMACICYQLAGGRLTRQVREFFSALEFFHLFALMHDDIIDHGVERHGVPTVQRLVAEILDQEERLGDRPHVAAGQAMLLGDFLHACANYFIMRGVALEPRYVREAQEHFDAMVQEVLLGEAVDVDLATRREVTRELINRKMYLKTASYTFIRPMLMGVVLAGGTSEMTGFCERFGAALGLAFQIQDDLLDLTARAEIIQKNVFSDLREHQQTVFTQHIWERGTDKQRQDLRGILGTVLAEADRERVTRLFEDSGALAAGRTLMRQHFDEAEVALEDLRIEPTRKKPLRDLVSYIRRRAY